MNTVPGMRPTLLIAALSLIATPDTFAQVVERHYDVRDLAGLAAQTVRDRLDLPPIALAAKRKPTPTPRKILGLPLTQRDDDRSRGIARFLRAFAKTDANDPVTIQAQHGVLSVSGASKHQDWVHNVVSVNRKKFEIQILVDARFYWVDPQTYRAYVQTIVGKDRAKVYSRKGAMTLADLLEQKKSVTAVAAPQVLVEALTRVRSQSVRRTTYVADYEVEIKTASVKSSPVIGVVRHGVEFRTDVGYLAEDVLGLAMEIDVARLHRPITVREQQVAGIDKVKIQVPKVSMGAASARVRLSPEHAVILASEDVGGRRLVAFVQATPNAEKKKQP